MAETTEFTIGADVSCTDGVCGEVSCVVVDTAARAVTHLAVEPKHLQGRARLVPIDLIDATTGEVRLRCTRAAFEKLDLAEESELWPGSIDGNPSFAVGPAVVTHDTVPAGEVTVHRGVHVHAMDGEIGRVQALVIDSRDHQVARVLLQEGHLWGRKEVAIPIAAVASFDNGIRLNITKQEVEDLPPVEVHHLAR
jgi:sporulation protein YlmC with PRC-barrel domain